MSSPPGAAQRVLVVDDEPKFCQAVGALRLGAQAFMCKPVDFRELERVISGVWPSTPSTGSP